MDAEGQHNPHHCRRRQHRRRVTSDWKLHILAAGKNFFIL